MDAPITGDMLRAVMRHVPAPVTVVTVVEAEGRRHGITIGSFTSLSLEPPLVSFNVDHRAAVYPALVEAEHFAVQVLAEDQTALSVHFAVPDLSEAEQFDTVPHTRDVHGVPILQGVAAVLHCRRYAAFELEGDTIFVGEVVAAREEYSRRPLLYYQGAYHGVGSSSLAGSQRSEPVKRASSETS